MADNYISIMPSNEIIDLVISSENTDINLSVESTNRQAVINIEKDVSALMSEKAEKAAEKAAQSAEEAKETLEETKTVTEEAKASIVATAENAQATIITTKEDAIEDINATANEVKEEILSKGAVTDVQANGTSVLVDGVANIPLATKDQAGLVRPVPANGINVSSTGTLNLSKLSDASLVNKNSNYAVLVSQIDLATKVGVTTNTIELTDEEKATACNWLGAAEVDNTLNKTQITNCITEIPQNIKLELGNGVLTLKAGSKVIVPNGAGVFDEVVITNDLSLGEIGSYTGSSFFAYKRSTNVLLQAVLPESRSGATDPHAGTNGFWYDTANNTVLNYYNGGTNVHHDVSFPFAIVHRTSGSWDKIEQVFNGIGYIGSTVWFDKGVKGLIPDGRNEDGTLRNIEFTTSKIVTYTNPSNHTYGNYGWVMTQNLRITPYDLTKYKYNGQENYNYELYGGQKSLTTLLASCSVNGGVISNFQPKQPFKAVDYNDKSKISSWAMPSSKYIDLTLGASGTTYTAPANGWLVFGKRVGGSTAQYILLINQTANMRIVDTLKGDLNNELGAYLPVNKGDKVRVDYNATGETTSFKFHYAEGEV